MIVPILVQVLTVVPPETGSVLFIGNGLNTNACLVADSYPDTQFHGMDLSPIQPDWVPQNVQFVVDDIEHLSGWTYEDDKFDYIHVRHTMHSIKDRQELWRRIYQYVLAGMCSVQQY